MNRDSNYSGDQIPLEPLITISCVNTGSPSNFLQLACGLPCFALNTFAKNLSVFLKRQSLHLCLKNKRERQRHGDRDIHTESTIIHFESISSHQNMQRAPPIVCLAAGDTQRCHPRERTLVIWVLYQKGEGKSIFA